MNIKKFFVKALITTCIASTMVPTVGLAYEWDHQGEDTITNFYTTTKTYGGSFATLYGAPQSTTIEAKTADYSGSYKWVRYTQQGQSGDVYYTKLSRENSGTSQPLSTTPVTIDASVVRRVHKGKIYNSSSSGSGEKETFYYKIKKA